MSIQLTSALLAGMALSLNAQFAAPHAMDVAKHPVPGLQAGAAYILYLGDLDGTPREILTIGQVPASGEQRLRLPAMRAGGAAMFLALDGSVYEVRGSEIGGREIGGREGRGRDDSRRESGREIRRPQDSGRPEAGPEVQVGKKAQWEIGRLQPYIHAQAPSPALGAANGDLIVLPGSPGDEQPVSTDVEKKGQWDVGRLHDDILAQAPSPTLGAGHVVLGASDQASGLDLVGDAREGGVISCPHGGPYHTDQGTLGTGGTLNNGLADHELHGDAAQRNGRTPRDRRNERTADDRQGSRGAVEVVDLTQAAGAEADLGGQVTVVISLQGLGLLMDF